MLADITVGRLIFNVSETTPSPSVSVTVYAVTANYRPKSAETYADRDAACQRVKSICIAGGKWRIQCSPVT